MSNTTINAQDAKEELAELLNRVTHYKERILLTRREKNIAAIVPIEDFYLLEELRKQQDLAEATDALNEARKEGSITIEKIKSEIG